MRYQVYLEDGIEGRALAWVLAYPGCYNYGATVDEALAGLPAVIIHHFDHFQEDQGDVG